VATFDVSADTRKHRLFVLTDISQSEPDDAQSMVRLMTYANEFDLEGLIATSSCHIERNDQPILPEYIHAIIKHYGRVRASLLRHAAGYPTEGYLHSLVAAGCGNGMKSVGEGCDSPGSDMLVSVVDRDDPRPVWVVVWGGAATLAQALWRVKEERPPEQAEAFASKLRVYDIDGQDDAGAWICHTFPSILYIRNNGSYAALGPRVDTETPADRRGGDESLMSTDWFRANVIYNHGALGHAYPIARYMYEGDTPSYLYLIPNGLSSPEHPHYGSWGGRFTREKKRNVPSNSGEWVTTEERYRDYAMHLEAPDRWSDGRTEHDNTYCALFRWREAIQNDFAARMDWCASPYDQANHQPVAVVNGNRTGNVIRVTAAAGERVALDGSESYDPDGNELCFTWWHYPEPGSWKGELAIEGADTPAATVLVPEANRGETFHVVLTVRDNGTPPLVAYRRIVFTIE
jgi:hypothetical protein